MGVGGGSQQTSELAGNFYCFLWRRTTSSSTVCAVSQVCCSRPQSSVLKHMRQTALGNSHQPLKTSLRLIGFWIFPLFLLCLLGIFHISQMALTIKCSDQCFSYNWIIQIKTYILCVSLIYHIIYFLVYLCCLCYIIIQEYPFGYCDPSTSYYWLLQMTGDLELIYV